MLFNALRMPVTYLYYELDPDGFIALLCENKDTPELECEGKCELKKVAESSTNNSKEPAKSIHYKEIQLFVGVYSRILFSLTHPSIQKHRLSTVICTLSLR